MAPHAVGRRRVRGRRLGSAPRLAAFLALLLSVVLAVAAYGTVRAFTSRSLASTTRSLVAEVHSFARATGSVAPSGLEAASVTYLRTQVLPQGQTMMIGLRGSVRLGSAGSTALLRTATVQALLARPPATTRSGRATLAGTDVLYLVAPIEQGTTTLGALVVAADLSQLHQDQTSVLVLVAGEALVALVGAVAGAYLLLRRLLRTVGRITTAAASIEGGDLDRRLGDQGTDDEVGQLAATFDAMLDRLQEAMTVQRRLLSDVSHQLRTPLTVARGHLEVLGRQPAVDPREVRETVDVVVDELDHMRALVERLLLLGRALEPDFLEIEHLDLRAFLADLVEAAGVLAVRRWSLAPAPDLVLEVDVAKLRGAMLNLVDNAIRATAEPDDIEIRASVDPGDGSIVLAVDDSGPGVPPEALQAVLARFGRLGSADRDGTGLGLAIVSAVAEAHGGRFELGRSPLGGCRAAIHLPAARVSSAGALAPVGT